MSKLSQQKRAKAVKSAAVFGLLTAAFYAAIFLNEGTVMKYFTKGGMYALLPVGAAFLVSFIHGAFAGNFWTALGIEASKKVTRVELPATQPAKRVRRPGLLSGPNRRIKQSAAILWLEIFLAPGRKRSGAACII